MTYQGGCHCGRIGFEVEGRIDQVVDCNCSMCRKRGGLLWFVPRGKLRLATPEADLGTYTFNTHQLRHHFCPACGIAPFSDGRGPGDVEMAAINVRCLDGVEPATLKVVAFDGKNK